MFDVYHSMTLKSSLVLAATHFQSEHMCQTVPYCTRALAQCREFCWQVKLGIERVEACRPTR